jgi:hypothetical protein
VSIANLGQVLLTAVVTAVVGLFVMESYQTTPWLADKLMRWSVRLRYTDNPERVTVRGEELISLLEDLPTLFKLPTAAAFLLRALAYRLASCRSHARLAVQRNALLLLTLYFFDCYAFSSWRHFGQAANNPWLILVWLYGLAMLVPLAWRDRAPVTVFSIQCALTVAAWPIMPQYIPIVGIPTAVYAVSLHRSRKVSLLALLASVIPIGLVAAVGFRLYPDPALQLRWIIPNTLIFVIVTVGAWGAGRMIRASQQHVQHQTEPRAVQRSLGVRFRIAVAKAGLVVVFASAVFGLELRLTSASLGQHFGVILTFCLAAVVLVAIESVARPPRFYPGLIGGTVCALSIFAFDFSLLFSGIAFGVTTALTCALIRKLKYVGVVIGVWVNIVGIALTVLADYFSPGWLAPVTGFSGLGFAVGALAGFAVAVERCVREKYSWVAARWLPRIPGLISYAPILIALPISLASPGAINPEPSIPLGEPHDEGELS